MTMSPGGPLNAIQPFNSPSPRLTSPTRFTWTDTGNLHLLQNQPSSPTYVLVEDVNRLSLDDKHLHQHAPFGSEGLGSPQHLAIRKGLPVNLPTFRHAIKEVVGKKVNKSRLRRLWFTAFHSQCIQTLAHMCKKGNSFYYTFVPYCIMSFNRNNYLPLPFLFSILSSFFFFNQQYLTMCALNELL